MKTIQILKNKGIVTLFRMGARKYIVPYISTPCCFLKILFLKLDFIKLKNHDSLIEFAYKTCWGYLKPMQIKSEISSLMKVIEKEKPKILMEIGTARGGTLFLFSRVMPKGSVIFSLDLPKGHFGGGYPFFKIPLYKLFAKNEQKINLIRANSHLGQSLKIIKRLLNNKKIDFLYIDGDHTYDGVKKDFGLYAPLVRRGGSIAFHDINKHRTVPTCQVDKLWNEIKTKYNSKELIENKNEGWGGIGILKVK